MQAHYKHKHILLLSLSAILASGCGSVVFEESKTFATGWAYADSARFTFTLPEAPQAVNLVLGLEVREEYPYRNIWLRFRLRTPDGKTQVSLREFVLAEPDGTWNVPASGGNLSFRHNLAENAMLDAPGPYTLEVVQFMRDDTLGGVRAVGLRVEAAG